MCGYTHSAHAVGTGRQPSWRTRATERGWLRFCHRRQWRGRSGVGRVQQFVTSDTAAKSCRICLSSRSSICQSSHGPSRAGKGNGDASARSLADSAENTRRFLRPPRVRPCVFVRCVRSHAAGCARGHRPFRGITAFAPVSRASASGIRLALPLAVGAIDRANLLSEHLRLIECGVGRRSGEWRSCRSARDGGTPGESGERHEEGETATRSSTCRIDGTVSFAIRKLWRRPHRA